MTIAGIPVTVLRGLMMIRCTPYGLCSWNYLLDGDGQQASLVLNWVGEQGAITADGVNFEVRKHGLASGHWTLDRSTNTIVSAQKTSPFTRTFEMQDADDSLVLSAESAFGRSFRLERGGEAVATIWPTHPFTRRATIATFGDGCGFSTICFAFWLVVLTWRRAAQNSS